MEHNPIVMNFELSMSLKQCTTPDTDHEIERKPQRYSIPGWITASCKRNIKGSWLELTSSLSPGCKDIEK